MTHRRTLVFLVAMALGGTAHADPTRRSADHFERGKAAYRLGEFDAAINHFREGYRIKADPTFLYNLALAYRGKGDFEQAIFFYQSYLRDAPDAPNREVVQAKIEELRRAIDEKTKATESPPKTPLAPDAVPRPEPAPDPSDELDPAPGRRQTFWIASGVAAGAGVLLAVTGAIFSARAAATEAHLRDAAAANEPWTSELAARDASGRRDAIVGAVGLGMGAAALATSGVLFYLGLRAGPHGPAVVPTASGFAVVGRF